MIVTLARWLAAFVAAFFVFVVIVSISATLWSAVGGDAQGIYMAGTGAGVFSAVLLGTAITPPRHRRIALWVMMGFMCVPSIYFLLKALLSDGPIRDLLWVEILSVACGLLFAPTFARSAIRGCEPRVEYPLSLTHPWLKNWRP